MEKLWFSSFAQATEWAQAQRNGVIRRSSDGIGFDWFPNQDQPSYRIDIDRLSTFISYSFGGMTIRCKDLFQQELRKWQQVTVEKTTIINESDKILVWTDVSTGLSWDAALVFQNPHGTIPSNVYKVQNEHNYGGFSDWRNPTIYELSTLVTELETAQGIYIKTPLLGKQADKSWGVSRWSFEDSKYFDFKLKRSEMQHYYEDEGSYKASWVASRSVRGEITISSIPWINSIVRWAAKNNNTGISFSENEIISLQELNIQPDIANPVEELPNEFLQLREVKIIRLGGVLTKIPDLIFQFFWIKVLDTRESYITEISEEISNLTNISALYIGGRIKKLPNNIVKLMSLKQLSLPIHSSFQITESQEHWIQELQKSGCVVTRRNI